MFAYTGRVFTALRPTKLTTGVIWWENAIGVVAHDFFLLGLEKNTDVFCLKRKDLKDARTFRDLIYRS
jgi:hypothetical protein